MQGGGDISVRPRIEASVGMEVSDINAVLDITKIFTAAVCTLSRRG